MRHEDRLAAFLHLGDIVRKFLKKEKVSYDLLLSDAIRHAQTENPWFTEPSILDALAGIAVLLEKDALVQWRGRYEQGEVSKRVACILAGNIPMVGFHDMLCVLLSGHCFVGKLSSKDKCLLTALIHILKDIAPSFQENISLVEDLKNSNYDAVIATGSNNSARYFEQYFAQIPHVIRKGRSSVAVLTGEETDEQLAKLGDDIFMYFGLGCRSVSKIYVPQGFDIRRLFPLFEYYSHYKNHYKWMNNYDYNRSINLVNQEEFYETGFALFQENTALVSPLAMCYYEHYDKLSELQEFLNVNSEQLQCIVANLEGEDFVPLGKSQFPAIDDYADDIDTMAFLGHIN